MLGRTPARAARWTIASGRTSESTASMRVASRMSASMSWKLGCAAASRRLASFSSRIEGIEIIDDGHRVAAFQQQVDEVRSDEPRAACHQEMSTASIHDATPQKLTKGRRTKTGDAKKQKIPTSRRSNGRGDRVRGRRLTRVRGHHLSGRAGAGAGDVVGKLNGQKCLVMRRLRVAPGEEPVNQFLAPLQASRFHAERGFHAGAGFRPFAEMLPGRASQRSRSGGEVASPTASVRPRRGTSRDARLHWRAWAGAVRRAKSATCPRPSGTTRRRSSSGGNSAPATSAIRGATPGLTSNVRRHPSVASSNSPVRSAISAASRKNPA